jgi:LDH2 family malate/lactate/ureidoglycolate dehydrogenase
MPLVKHMRLKALAKAIFVAAKSSETEADLVAENLVRANLCGVDSHGVIRIPDYIEMVDAGKLRPNSIPRIVSERKATASVNADFGYGQVSAKMAMELAISKAKDYGTGTVCVFNCNHVGRLADYTILAVENDMIGLFVVKSLGSVVAPWGGKGRVLSTSPISFAIPAESEPPIVLDFATSISAEGKVRIKHARREKIPLGWVTDAYGRPTEDPGDLYCGGALATFGTYKGYGLNLVAEALGGAMAGGGVLDDFDGTNGIFAQAINIDAFADVQKFKSRIDKLIRAARATPPAEGFEEVLIPGDPELREMERRIRKGIGIESGTWDRLVQVANKYGVSVPKP